MEISTGQRLEKPEDAVEAHLHCILRFSLLVLVKPGMTGESVFRGQKAVDLWSSSINGTEISRQELDPG